MIDVTRKMAEELIDQLSIGYEQMVVEDEPDCIDLAGPTFAFTLVKDGMPFTITVKKLQRRGASNV